MSNTPSAPVMLLTKTLSSAPAGGRELLCKLNHDMLRDIYGSRLITHELVSRPLRQPRDVLNAFRGYIDGVNAQVAQQIIDTIRSEHVAKVFIDGSNLGVLASLIKPCCPKVEITTFFHNVESRFFLGAWRERKSLRSFLVMMVNFLAERQAVLRSDKIICLSERDSKLLERLYGRAATHLSAMALQDKLPPDHFEPASPAREKFILFVGGVFYANQAGIAWYVQRVVPQIKMKTYIVGRGFEHLREQLQREHKVEVVGAVDSLADWYRDAYFVVAPIFDGSGMKTKVAEALMYGKKIIGTPESFSGYEGVGNVAGRICSTADEFAAAINVADQMVKARFDPTLRELYVKNYSLAAARERLAAILAA